MIDFDKVERFDDRDIVQGELLGQSGSYVNAADFDALLCAYKETRRALEIGARDEFYESWRIEEWISEARTELAAMQGRAG